MSPDDDFRDDSEFQDFADEMQEHEKAVYELVSNYMDDLDIPEAIMSHVLLSLAVNMRMVAYVIDTEKPSSAGLKLDLDRMRSEVEQLLREVKKGAEAYVKSAKAAVAEAEKEDGN
jgi:hypothetical protein